MCSFMSSHTVRMCPPTPQVAANFTARAPLHCAHAQHVFIHALHTVRMCQPTLQVAANLLHALSYIYS